MAPSDRELLLQAQGVQAHRHARRQDRSELRSHDLSRRRRHQFTMKLNRPYFDGSLSFGFVGYEASRRVALGAFSNTQSASPDGSFVAFGGDTGYRFERAGPPGLLRWGPIGELRFSNVAVDGYSETGATSLTARVRGRDAASVQTGLGAETSL